jgi:hypothetical protein
MQVIERSLAEHPQRDEILAEFARRRSPQE